MGKNKKRGGQATKTAKKEANSENLTGLDALLDEHVAEMKQQEANEHAKQMMLLNRSGAENARIGMAGFSEATQNPTMFAEAMTMLKDPDAVKEAEKMMNDPEFKTEIDKYMQQLKQDPSFLTAMQSAQSKFQELMTDPTKLQNMSQQYSQYLEGGPPPDFGAAGVPAPGGAEAGEAKEGLAPPKAGGANGAAPEQPTVD